MVKEALTDKEKAMIAILWQNYIPLPSVDNEKAGKEEEKN